MENNDVVNTVSLMAEHEGLQAGVAVEVDRLENGGGVGVGGGDIGGHEGAMVVAVVANGGVEGGFPEKRKRGRPRKQLGEIRQELSLVAGTSGAPQKRGRGRPRGSGKWQTLATTLGLSAGQTSGGSNFTPHILEIQPGEDIVQKIGTFSQITSHSICILSACGTVSRAEIYLPASPDGIVFEGDFTIVCLNGSHIYEEKSRVKSRLLSVQLSHPNGRAFGGAVGNSLIAAGPTKVIVSTFKQKFRHQVSRRNIGGNENGAVVVPPLQAAVAVVEENGGRLSEIQRVPEVVFNQSAIEPADWDSLQPLSNV